MASDKSLTGSAGVHYVAFQLASRGIVPALSGPGVKAIDLLAGNAETGKSISVQVKTGTDAHVDVGKPRDRWKWRIGKQLGEGVRHKDFFVAFVNLRGGPPRENDVSWNPEVFVIPTFSLDKFVWGYPEQEPTDYWFVLDLKDAYRYRNRWDLIDKVLS